LEAETFKRSIMGLGAHKIFDVDLATEPDKTAVVTKKLTKSVHNHPRKADGKKVVTLSERKKAKRKIARKSKQRNRKYA